ncbi:ATP-binding cassette domain-containing protein [Pendulispora albinea]|uniref:ATP-binding cassette domain-containing protein n=1 Tax=Pendulispora albinea TaxID=2741071 RepID=A0ABZ2LXD5_9BACT
MIELERTKARAAPVGLGPLSASFGAGIWAILGTKSDGVSLLLDVLAARVRHKAGGVTVLGDSPDAPEIRRAVGYVPLDAVLPDELRVAEALELARAIRGDGTAGSSAARNSAAGGLAAVNSAAAGSTARNSAADPVARLSQLGLESLAPRRLRTLDRAEIRAVAMAEALTSQAVRVLLVEEPFLAMDARAVSVLPKLLRQRAKDGACIVIGTASPRDARALTDKHLTLERGVLSEAAPHRPSEVELHVVASDPRILAGALAREEAALAIVASDHGVIVRGTDPLAMAGAVSRAVLASGVTLDALRLEEQKP